MTSITIDDTPLKTVKRALQEQVSGIKSAHLSEAIAAGLGYKSHAALKASMLDEDPDIRLLDQKTLEKRAASLGAPDIGFDTDWFENELCQAGDGIYRTQHPRDEDLDEREGFRLEDPASFDAWQNLAIAGVNTMIRKRIFTIRPGDDRWDWRHAPSLTGERHFPTFTLKAEWEGVPLLVCATFTHHHEVSLRVIAWPTEAAFDPALYQIIYMEEDEAARAGRLSIQVCLERQKGAWLQSGSYRNIHGPRDLIEQVAALPQEWPLGYAREGMILL